LLDQIEILNTFYEERRKSLLLLTLEEVLAVNAAYETAVAVKNGNKIDRVSGY